MHGISKFYFHSPLKKPLKNVGQNKRVNYIMRKTWDPWSRRKAKEVQVWHLGSGLRKQPIQTWIAPARTSPRKERKKKGELLNYLTTCLMTVILQCCWKTDSLTSSLKTIAVFKKWGNFRKNEEVFKKCNYKIFLLITIKYMVDMNSAKTCDATPFRKMRGAKYMYHMSKSRDEN